jgi:hypothetical protein
MLDLKKSGWDREKRRVVERLREERRDEWGEIKVEKLLPGKGVWEGCGRLK